MAVKITIAILTTVAKEFNKIMKLEPPIETGKGVKIDQLQADVVEAAKELAPDDQLSKANRATLEALDVVLPESNDQKSPDKPVAKPPKEPAKPRYSRIQAAVEAIGEDGIDSEDLVSKANEMYIQNANNGKDNEAEAKWAVNMVLKVMAAMKEFKVKA
jgi:hypothetical protein